jgi:hypothetical protein
MISGRDFANACDWIYDKRYTDKRFSDVLSKSGDRVFINGDQVYEFIHKKNSSAMSRGKKFHYVIHNSDLSFTASTLNDLLPHATCVYAINTTVRHPQLRTIPIGFQDSSLEFFRNLVRPEGPRDIEVYMNITLGSPGDHRHTIRKACVDAMQNDPRVVSKTNRTISEYASDLCRSTYVLCPAGTGIDTHRIYESILCGAIPVVLRSHLDHLYYSLPVCIVNAWTDPYYEPKGKTAYLRVPDYM